MNISDLKFSQKMFFKQKAKNEKYQKSRMDKKGQKMDPQKGPNC